MKTQAKVDIQEVWSRMQKRIIGTSKWGIARPGNLSLVDQKVGDDHSNESLFENSSSLCLALPLAL
jgi:hypothetical protein